LESRIIEVLFLMRCQNMLSVKPHEVSKGISLRMPLRHEMYRKERTQVILLTYLTRFSIRNVDTYYYI